MSNTIQNIFFNTLDLKNDLEGELKGSVLFTQATVLPSRASTIPKDIQPRMVSYRNTMVLFKPLTQNINFDDNLVLNIIDENNSLLFSTSLKNPDQLPEPTERFDVNEADFIEPESYDYVIKSQSEFNKMDVNGNYLSTLLETSNTIKIITSDGNWFKDIHLPSNISSQNGKLITFEQNAGYSSAIFYAQKNVSSQRNKKLLFKNINGSWNMPADLPYSQAESIFADPGKYDYVINSQNEISATGNDPKASHLKSLLVNYKTINIRLADGCWTEAFYLPENDSSLNGKKIIFYSDAGYSSRVYYSEISLLLNQRQSLVFINNNGVWREWSDSQYAKISYGQNFWSGVIPWRYVYPGVSLRFQVGNLAGVYNTPDIGAPGELLLHTVDIGMLTPNQQHFSFQYNDDYHRQYFQQIPASRLIVNEYEPVYWQEIMLPDGTRYLDHSSNKGDVYNGDLRQRIGKELISLGINNANYGIHSSPGIGEGGLNHSFASAQVTAHNSVGNYINGRVVHGLSGGGGIVTLQGGVGNEFSHELGHNYELGHFPNGFDGSIHRSAENINSTWGWDSDKFVFIPNFEKSQSGASACYDNECQPPFNDHRFGADAMAGGYPLYVTTSDFTLYTPYSHHQIQKFFEGKVVFDKSSSTGYKKWSEDTKSMVEWAEFYDAKPDELDLNSMSLLLGKYTLIEISQYDDHYAKDIFIPPASVANKSKGIHIVHNAAYSATVHVNNEYVTVSRGDVFNYESNGSTWILIKDFSFNVVRNPEQQGVPVTTILGYYDPDNILHSYIYPALHGAYGYTYRPDRDVEVNATRSYAEVINNKKQSLKFILRGERVDGITMNRLHINVASSFSPSLVTIYSDGIAIVTKEILPPAARTHFTINGRQ